MIHQKLIVYTLAVLWGITVLIQLFVKVILNGVYSFWPDEIAVPNELYDTKYGNHEFITIKSTRGIAHEEIDLKIHCVVSGTQNKPVMLMIHGFPEFWYSYRYQILEFQSTHKVIAFDLRGYGDSDKPANVANFRIDHLVNDIHKIIEHFSKNQPVTLLSHDWGGAIAWEFLLKHPEQVANFVSINGPFLRATVKVLSSKLSQFLKSSYAIKLRTFWRKK